MLSSPTRLAFTFLELPWAHCLGQTHLGQQDAFLAKLPIEDGDGPSPSIENGAPNNGDGNSDGILDSEQANVASLPSITGEYITLASTAGDLRSVSVSATPPNASLPLGAQFPTGFLSYSVASLALGQATTVALFVPDGVAYDSYYKYGPTHLDNNPHWYEFLYDGQTGAEFYDDDSDGDTDRIVLHLVDGVRGDDDLLANGVIVDPGAPALSANSPPSLRNLSLTPATFENGIASLSGEVVDSDAGDSHTVVVDWGDGNSEAVSLARATTLLSPVSDTVGRDDDLDGIFEELESDYLIFARVGTDAGTQSVDLRWNSIYLDSRQRTRSSRRYCPFTVSVAHPPGWQRSRSSVIRAMVRLTRPT